MSCFFLLLVLIFLLIVLVLKLDSHSNCCVLMFCLQVTTLQSNETVKAIGRNCTNKMSLLLSVPYQTIKAFSQRGPAYAVTRILSSRGRIRQRHHQKTLLWSAGKFKSSTTWP